MKKYQIYETSKEKNHAGSKATADIETIAEELGYEPVYIKMITEDTSIQAKVKRQVQWMVDWVNAYDEIGDSAVVLLQCPFHHRQLRREETLLKLKKEKNAGFICVVHDVEELRGYRFNDYYKKEFEFMLQNADVLIVHNEVMKDYFISCGYPADRIVSLGIFDYLHDNKEKLPEFRKKITIAGNLDTEKCRYLTGLTELKDVEIDLYGSNFDRSLKKSKNIDYRGSLAPAKIPKVLKSGFGLVWDGTSIDGCQGESGQYLKYNNPHKLSLYLSAGLPVVIWKDAAEASFVMQNGVGIAVSSLYEMEEILNGMSDAEYREMAENAAALSRKLKSGYFAKQALARAESILEEGKE